MHNYILDLFQPHTIIETIIYQYGDGKGEWDSKHIRAMLHLCDYVRHTYPDSYRHVSDVYEHFLIMNCDDNDPIIPIL